MEIQQIRSVTNKNEKTKHKGSSILALLISIPLEGMSSLYGEIRPCVLAGNACFDFGGIGGGSGLNFLLGSAGGGGGVVGNGGRRGGICSAEIDI